MKIAGPAMNAANATSPSPPRSRPTPPRKRNTRTMPMTISTSAAAHMALTATKSRAAPMDSPARAPTTPGTPAIPGGTSARRSSAASGTRRDDPAGAPTYRDHGMRRHRAVYAENIRQTMRHGTPARGSLAWACDKKALMKYPPPSTESRLMPQAYHGILGSAPLVTRVQFGGQKQSSCTDRCTRPARRRYLARRPPATMRPARDARGTTAIHEPGSRPDSRPAATKASQTGAKRAPTGR